MAAATDRLYSFRFDPAIRDKRIRMWQALVEGYFRRFVGEGDTVLDFGCGYGEFLNHLRCARRIGVDQNTESAKALAPEIEFHETAEPMIPGVADGSVDLLFCSNVLEHLTDKEAVEAALGEFHRVLKPDGRLLLMGPNIRYVYEAYWDFWDHRVALSDRSLEEVLHMTGFEVTKSIPRFLPYTTCSRLPMYPWMIRLYLACPPVWSVLGKQFLIHAKKITP